MESTCKQELDIYLIKEISDKNVFNNFEKFLIQNFQYPIESGETLFICNCGDGMVLSLC